MAKVVRAVSSCLLNSTKSLSLRTCATQKNLGIFRYYSRSAPLFAERRYSEKHEWVSVKTVDGKCLGTVGISDYAQDKLGDIVYAQLPEEGETFMQEDECGALESVKAASELYCPVAGQITKKNQAVEDKPALINSSCYDKGWLFELEVASQGELDALMDEEAYSKFLESQD